MADIGKCNKCGEVFTPQNIDHVCSDASQSEPRMITRPEVDEIHPLKEVTPQPEEEEEERVTLNGIIYRRDDCGTWWILYGDESGPHSWSHTLGILAVALGKCRTYADALREADKELLLMRAAWGVESPVGARVDRIHINIDTALREEE